MSNIFEKPSMEEFNEWRAHKLVENFMNADSIAFYKNITSEDYCVIKKSEFVESIPEY